MIDINKDNLKNERYGHYFGDPLKKRKEEKKKENAGAGDIFWLPMCRFLAAFPPCPCFSTLFSFAIIPFHFSLFFTFIPFPPTKNLSLSFLSLPLGFSLSLSPCLLFLLLPAPLSLSLSLSHGCCH